MAYGESSHEGDKGCDGGETDTGEQERRPHFALVVTLEGEGNAEGGPPAVLAQEWRQLTHGKVCQGAGNVDDHVVQALGLAVEGQPGSEGIQGIAYGVM